ncbi:MAG: hypothetical protein ABIT38_20625, partial [Gemmatimonadaceae bacterium]
MTRRALPVVETPDERRAIHVAILLRVGIVTRGARHPAVHVTVRPEMRFLVGKGPHASIGEMRSVAELR